MNTKEVRDEIARLIDGCYSKELEHPIFQSQKFLNELLAYLRSEGVVRKKSEKECICGGVSSYINSEKQTCPFCYGSKKFIEVEEI